VFEATDALVDGLVAEHQALGLRLADPAVHGDPREAQRLGRHYAELGAVVTTLHDWQRTCGDLAAARELGADDAALAAEAGSLERRRDLLAERLRRLLVPRSPLDGKDVIVEVKAGEGGEESALFAADLLRMYTRYAERTGWRTQLLDSTGSDLGGVRSATLAVQARAALEPGRAPYASLKHEAGVHRVQRVPVTESQGRIHTSAAGVLVLPEADPVDVEIDDSDLRVDVFRSSGPGGQSVNTTDSAVRITHAPTGIVVSCQNEKSQLQNREQAMRILRARLLALAEEQAHTAATDARRAQVRTVDRSERIRTYNFPENRVTDHRTGYKTYALDQVLDGALDDLVRASVEAEEAERMAALGSGSGSPDQR